MKNCFYYVLGASLFWLVFAGISTLYYMTGA